MVPLSMGASFLITRYGGSRLAVAEAFILGEVDMYEDCISELVDPITLETAKIRLNALGLLNEKHIKPVRKKI